jgi:tetratricopeptide (TPR) repeat protein
MKTRSIAAVLLLAFAPVVAFAQPADDPTIKAARARFQEGVAFYDKGEYENARAAFLQAYALRKHPAVLLNLAQSSLRAGHALEASKYFQQYLRESSNLSPAQRADAERGLTEARQKLGRIEVSAPTGVAVVVDNEMVGSAPLSEAVDVEPGNHKVKAGAEEQTITVMAGQKTAAKFGGGTSAPPPVVPVPTPPAPTGNTPATTTPPTTDTTTPPGSGATTPPAGDTGEVKVEPKKNILSPPANMVPVYVGGVIAVVGAGVAIGVGVIAKSSAQNSADSVASEIRKNGGTQGICSRTDSASVNKFGKACAALADDNSKVDTDATVGNIGLAVGIAGAAFALGWYLFAPKRSDRGDPNAAWKTVTVSPMLGLNNGGLAASGTF